MGKAKVNSHLRGSRKVPIGGALPPLLLRSVEEVAEYAARWSIHCLSDPEAAATAFVNAAVRGLAHPRSLSAPSISDAVVAQVVSAWLRDPRYCDERGAPRSINLRGPPCSLSDLLRRNGLKLNPNTVVDYLIGTRTVRRVRGKLELLQSWVSVRSRRRELQYRTWQVLVDTIHTLSQNLQPQAPPLVERSSEHPAVPERLIPEVYAFAAREGKAFLERFDAFLDRCAATAKAGEPVIRMGVSVKQFQGPALDFSTHITRSVPRSQRRKESERAHEHQP